LFGLQAYLSNPKQPNDFYLIERIGGSGGMLRVPPVLVPKNGIYLTPYIEFS
jgi:hypothetical protein